MITETEDTIVAVATPPGRAALGMIRISGKKCREILPRIFQPRHEKGIEAFRPLIGKVVLDPGQSIDEAVLTFYEQPHSYTREDLAEITCHGNPLILDRVLNQAVSCGARHARPGEFTYRAFLNGRIDLVQAEAVRDLINADSLYQAELALHQLDGRLSSQFQTLRQKLIACVALLEGNIDFSEEQHYEFIDRDGAILRVDSILHDVRTLLGTFERGRLIREGFQVAIVGKPNSGKSCLFNNLLGQNRAIVTPIPGTTRDYLRERITIGDYVVNLLDTAGIRTSTEVIEQEGIRRSREIIERADLILFLLDGTGEVDEEDRKLWASISNRDVIIVCNKSDDPAYHLREIAGQQAESVSALTGAGVDQLINAIASRIDQRVRYHDEDSLISSFRHRDLLRKAVASLERARDGMEKGMSEEFPLTDLHEAMQRVGEITGEVTIEDIYSHIFRNFCIGK